MYRPPFRAMAAALCLIGFMSYAWLTVRQIRVWKNPETLWAHVIKLHPQADTAYYNLAEHFHGAGDLQQAQRLWLRTIEVQPRHSEALNQMKNLSLMRGDDQEAEAYYRRSVNSRPDAL